jgi:hypothetical protein
MFRQWFEEGISDGEVFRRRARWLSATLVLADLVLIVSVLATR